MVRVEALAEVRGHVRRDRQPAGRSERGYDLSHQLRRIDNLCLRIGLSTSEGKEALNPQVWICVGWKRGREPFIQP